MGDFVDKVALEMRPRLGLDCNVILGPQTDFSQPMVLVNETPLGHMFDDWNEDSAWDALAEHQDIYTPNGVPNVSSRLYVMKQLFKSCPCTTHEWLLCNTISHSNHIARWDSQTG